MMEQLSLFGEQDAAADLMPSKIPQRVQYGDIWQLGQHRLICSDATSVHDVSRLFAGDQFALCFTSPPYSDQRRYKIGSFDWHSMMCGSFDRMIENGREDCHILINLGLKHENRQVDMYWMQWLIQCATQGWPLFGWYVWDKASGVPRENDGRLMINHEFIFHFNQNRKPANKWIKATQSSGLLRGGMRRANGEREKVWSPDKMGQTYAVPMSTIHITKQVASGIHTTHPAVFPVALPEFIMKTWSQPDDIVYEPFCGSGTSLIAGSNLKRRVFACEIAPEYCDLALARWEIHTGQKAVLVERIAEEQAS